MPASPPKAGVLWILALAAPLVAGPGLGNLEYTATEVGKPVSFIQSRAGHSQVAMHRGHLVVVYSKDGGQGEGGISFYDISNPRRPVLVHDEDNRGTWDIRETHGWSMRRDVACLQANFGIQFWDFSEVTRPRMLSYLRLPGITISDYDLGMWWTHWQGRYVYGGGSGSGLYIVDAADPAKPVFVKKIPVNETGGFRIGSVHAIGNLLVLSGTDVGGLSVLDISNPVSPKLVATSPATVAYSSGVNGNKVVLAGTGANSGRALVYDISDPNRIEYKGQSSPVESGTLDNKGGYVSFQDGHAFVGFSGAGFAKMDLARAESWADFTVRMTGSSQVKGRDEDFATPLGNLVFASSDGKTGSALIPHQAGRDTTGPAVSMVVPANGAVGQARTTRVGLTFTDQIDGSTVDSTTLVVRKVGGQPLSGYYTVQNGIVNFHPRDSLQANATYEVVVRAGGIRDYAGNPVAARSATAFSTGNRVDDCAILPVSPVTVNDSASFDLTCANPVSGLVTWEFGDGRTALRAMQDDPVRHKYARKGSYNVFARVPGRAFPATALQSVYNPVSALRGRHSSTLVLASGAQRLWNVNVDNNSVTVTDRRTLSKIREIPVGEHPRTVALDANGNAWVANQDDATLSLVDAAALKTVFALELPRASRPYGVCFSPRGDTGYVTLEATGELVMFSALQRKVLARLPLFPSARAVAVSGDGARIFVSRYISGETQGEIAEVSASPFVKVRTIPLAYDEEQDSQSGGSGVPNAVASLVVAPDGRNLWAAFKKDNVKRGLFADPKRGESNTFETTVRTSVSQIALETSAEIDSSRTDLDNRSMADAIAFDSRGLFTYVSTQTSNHTVILNGLTGKPVTAIEPDGLNQELAPDGILVSEDDSLLFVHYFLSRELAAYDISQIGKTNQLPRKALIPTITQEKLAPQVLKGKQLFYNAADPRMSRDRYMSCAVCHMEGGSDGRVWDFTHRGEGLRRTTTLIGRGGMAAGPLHWSANFDEIQDFEHDVRSAFEGTGFMKDEQFKLSGRDKPLGGKKAGISAELDALSAYITSLATPRPSPYRSANGELTEAAKAGALIFQRPDVGCATCHAPPRYTNSGKTAGVLTYPVLPSVAPFHSALTNEGFLLHNVGTFNAGSGKRMGDTLLGLDTPSLLGIWENASFLHNGSAKTLLDVITTANPQDRHGRTSHLTGAEKNQLVQFLMQVGPNDTLPEPFDADADKASAPPTLLTRKTGGTYVFTWNLRPGPDASMGIYTLEGHRVAVLRPSPVAYQQSVFFWDVQGAGLTRANAGVYVFQLRNKGRTFAQRLTLAL